MPKIQVPFGDAPDDSFVDVGPGDYPVRVSKIEQKVGKSSGKPYLLWHLRVTDGPYKGGMVFNNTSLQPHALFALRNTLVALGLKVPKSMMELDTDHLIGMTMGISVEKDDKGYPVVTNTYPHGEGDSSPTQAEEVSDDDMEAVDLSDL